MPVLVLAAEDDAEARCVAAALEARGAESQWFDTSWFPGHASVSVDLAGDGWHGVVKCPHGLIELDEVTAIYYGPGFRS